MSKQPDVHVTTCKYYLEVRSMGLEPTSPGCGCKRKCYPRLIKGIVWMADKKPRNIQRHSSWTPRSHHCLAIHHFEHQQGPWKKSQEGSTVKRKNAAARHESANMLRSFSCSEFLEECPLDRLDKIGAFWKVISALLSKMKIWSFQSKEQCTHDKTWRSFIYVFYGCLLQLTLRTLNLCKEQWILKTVKTSWIETYCPLWVS